MSQPNIITRGFRWVVDALGLSMGMAPNELSREVLATLDLTQRGWGHADTVIAPFTWTVAPGTTGATYDLLTGINITAGNAPAALLSQQQVIVSLSVVAEGGAVVGDAWLQYRANSGQAILHGRATIPIDLEDYTAGADPVFDSSVAAPQDWMPWGPLWVPPGYRAQLRFLYSTDANQTLRISGAAATMRAGFAGGAP